MSELADIRLRVGRWIRRPLPAFVAAALLAAAAVVADPYPPYWTGGSGSAIHYAPVAWPAGGASTANWIPYTRIGSDIADKRDSDGSNGGTSPQSYVNVSSGCTDITEPSVYYAYDSSSQVLFFRWRVQAPPNTFATGPNPGTYASSSPWSSALWTVFVDTNGDGYRDFAVHLNGSSGSPSAAVDRLVSVWSATKSQSLDYENDPAIHLLHHNPAAFVDGPSATDRILNFHNALSPDASWPNGSGETTWDYGTTRASALGTSCGEYFIDYQIPLAMLDASAVGGPTITPNTPMSLFFATANSLQNPVQKDAVVAGDFVADPTRPVPGGDTITPAGGTIQQPTVTSITATGCGSTSLTASVFDTLNVDRSSTVGSVAFYDYYDSNANGSADDGGTWTFAANGAAASDPIGKWTATWNSSSLIAGKYLLAVKATDTSGNVTWSQFSTQADVNAFTGGAPGNFPNAIGTTATSMVNSCGASAPSITKSVSPSFIAAGGTVTFTVSIANTLGTAMTVSSITDAMPSGFTYQSTSGGGTIGSPSTSPSLNATGNITWTFGPASIPAGSTRTLIFTAKAGSTSGTFTNSVSASTSYGTLTSGATDVGVGSPSLTIAKSASVTSANPGDAVAYTITYANDSPVNVSNAVITDVLPTGLTFVSATGGGTYSAGTRTVTWNIGSLTSGSGASSVMLNVTIDNPYSSSAAIPVVNTASITSTETSAASSSASVYVNAPRPALAIVNTGNAGLVAAGGSITYTLLYANTGVGTASGVTITDVIPAGWSFSSATGGGTNAGGTVTWTIGTLAAGVPGSVTLTLAASSPYTGSNPSTDTATISGTGLTSAFDSFTVAVTQTGSVCSTYYFRPTTTSVGFDGTQKIANTTAVIASDTGSTTSNTSTGSGNTVELVRFYADPAVSSQVDLSGTLTSGIYIDRTNGAGVNVTGTVYDYNSSTGARTSLGATTTTFNGSAKGLFSFSIPVSGSLLAGHRLLWIYTFASANSQAVQLYSEFGGTVTNPLSGGTVAALASSNFCATAPASPTLNKGVDKLFASPGDTLTYTIRFANAGGTNMTSAQIVDTLPSGVTYGSATLNGSAVSPSSSVGQQYTFAARSSDTATSGQVTSAQAGTLVITATVSQPFTGPSDTLTNSATLSSTQTSTLTDAVTTTLQRPSVTISKSADRTLLVPGDTVTYTLTALNGGPGSASSVTVADSLPATVYFTYVAGSAKLNGVTISPDPVSSNVLTKNIGSLAAGSAASVSFQMLVASSGAPSGTTPIANTATVTDAGTSGSRSSNATSVTISTNPNLALVKSSAPASGPVAAGSTITYTLIVSNTGSADASGVKVKDLIPSSTTYASGTLTFAGAAQTDASGDDNSAFEGSGNDVLFTIGTLTAGSSRTLSYQVTVNSPLSAGTIAIGSTATASATNASSKTASASITASAAPALTLTKSAPSSVAYPLTTLAAAASGATSVTVASAAAISIGDVISVGGTTATVTGVSGTTVTLGTAVTASGGTQVLPTWEYRLDYANSGTAAASSVVVTDVLPAGLTFITADNGGGDSSGTVTWNLGVVTSGSSGTLRVRVRPSSAATYSNTASLASAELSTVTSNTTSTSTGALTVDKSTSTPSAATVGTTTTATYVITLTNQSPSAAANSVSVQDDLPAGFTYLSTTSIVGATAGVSPSAGAASPVWSGLTVPAGSTATITFTVKVSNVSAGTYQNYVTVGSSNANVLGFDTLSTTSDDVTISAPLGTTGIVTITATIAPGAPETIGVSDPDLNTDPSAVETVQVTVADVRTGEFETLTLTETGANTGVFGGTLATNAMSTAGLNNSPPLNVASGDTVRVSYSDALTSTGGSAVVTADGSVLASNTAPVAVVDSYSVNEDATLTVAAAGVLTNDTDAEGNALIAVLVSDVAHGTLSLNPNGSFTYTPTANYSGADSFTYKANDGTADSNTVTVTITVNAVNDAPVAVADSYSVNEDATLTVTAAGVLTNDTDAEGNSLTAVLVSDVAHGTLSLNANGSFTYTPTANYSGLDSFTYKANDGTADSNTVTVSITVNAVNDAPAAVADNYSVNEDATLTVTAAGVLTNDTDAEGNALTAVLVSDVAHGTLSLNPNGSFTYTPTANYSGSDSFTYKANDGTADSNTVTVSITVNAVNDAPVAVTDSYSVNEDATLTVTFAGVLTNDTDAEGNALTAVLVSDVAHGTLSLNANGGFTYTPTANYSGSDSFTYKANDGTADSNTVTVSITVNAVNDAPVAVTDSYSVNEDATLTVTFAGVLTNDTDAEGNALTAVLVSDVAHGTLSLNANGGFTYTPAANYSGPDGFTYKANDGTADSNTVTVSITVNAVNDAPAAVADNYSVNEDATLTVAAAGVLTNDTDAEGNALTAVLVSDVAHGTLSLNPNGSFTYTPAANYSGADSFTYKANDGTADSNTVTVSITVNAVNDAPAAVADNYSVNEDATLTVAAAGVLTNDTDAEGNALTAVLVSDVAHGTLSLNANGGFTHTPTANYSGLDSFTYKANDGTADSNTVTVSITVNAVNDAPVAVADSYSVNEDATLTVTAAGVLTNDTDAEGNALTSVLVTDVTHGALSFNANGGFTYTPAANYSGPDGFTYKANDGTADSNTVTVSITVNAVNDAPVAVADSYSVNEDATLTVAAAGVLTDDTDAEGNALTAVLVSDVAHGTLSLNPNGSFTYTPTANYSGSDSFTYKANDGTADSNTVTVSITVNAVNDAPVAVADSYSVNEDATLTVTAAGVLTNDTDAEGNALTAVLVSDVAHGTLSLNANGGFTYTPTANYSGLDSFTYKANDGTADSNTVTVSITVNAVNDAPVAVADSYAVNEDATLTVAAAGVLTNDTDAEGNSLTAVLVSDVAHGTLSLNPNGSLTYTPTANYNGADSFTYKANDGTTDSNTVTVSITVNAVNDAPVAVTDNYSVNEDATLTVTAAGVLTNDTDAEGNALTAVLVSDVAHGTLSLNANGGFTYTPTGNYSGSDSFTYKANDGTADSNTVTVTITVNAVNDAPVAVADSYSVNEDATLTVTAAGVLTNDTDAEGNALTAVLVSDVAHGTLSLNANGGFTYTPTGNYSGSDSFTYKANDGTADSNTVTVTITVNAVNDAPVAVADSYSVNEDATLTVTAAGVLTNDTDAEGNALTAVLVSDVAHGTLSLNANGGFTYTPTGNYSGSDSFTYKANDGTADSNTVTVTITVNAVNDAPVAVADSYSVNEDATLTVTAAGVLTNDTDAEGNALTAVLVSDVAHGTLSLNANGGFTYTPTGNYSGSDSFTYKANDGTADSNTVTVTITVNAVNDAPVAVADSYSVNEDATLTVTAAGVLTNDTDAEGNALTAVLVSDVAHGTLSLNANGSFTYAPTANYNGADSFTYKANDGTADSNTVTVSITVNAVNDAPVAVADSYAVNEDATLTVAAAGVLTNDTDAEGNALTAVLVSDVAHGTLSLNANGSFTYAPTANYNGADSFTYKANDGTADSNTVTVSITVNAVNDAPVAVADSYSVNEDATLTVTAAGVLTNDTDAEGNALTAVLVSDVAHGTLSLNANGSFTYTPASGYSGTDSFTYKANDGTADSNTVTVTIPVNGTNDAPLAVADSYTVGEDTVLTAAAPGVLTNDTDADGDALSAILVSGVSHGTLTLNANGSFTYTPAADYSGADSFTYKVNDATADSNVVTVAITVTSLNDPPVVRMTPVLLPYAAGAGAVVLDGGLTVTDPDSPTLAGATMRFVGAAFDPAADTLGFTAQNGITGTWNAAAGVLTLTGTAAVADYQAALRSVTYTNGAALLTSQARTVSVSVTDGEATSNLAARSIAIAGSHQPPVVAMTLAPLAFTEASDPAAADAGLRVTDADTPTLARATMTLTSNYAIGEDELAFQSQNGITGVWNAASGTLALSGTATVAQYETALRSITFVDRAASPSTATRTVAVVANDGVADSNVATRQIVVSRLLPPTIDQPAAMTVDEDSGAASAVLSGIGPGTPGATVTVTAQPSDGTLFSAFSVGHTDPSATGAILFTPAPDAFGSTQVTVTVTAAGRGAPRIVTRVFTITIAPVNDAPTLDALADRSATAGADQSIPLTGIGTGAANEIQPLTVTATSSNPAVVPAPAVSYASASPTGSLSLRAAAGGTAVITVTVDDAQAVNHSVTRTFTVTAAPRVNTPPTISAIPDVSAIEGERLPSIAFTIADAETPASGLTVTYRSVNGTLLPSSGITLTGGDAIRALTLAVPPNRVGRGRIIVTVSDGELSASTSFAAVVRPLWNYYLADGSAAASVATDIHATNPNGEPAPVRLTFVKPSGEPENQFVDIPSMSRWSARLSQLPAAGGGEVSTFIRSMDNLPLLVERTMRWDGDAHAGSAETALESTNTRWYFADGGQGALRTTLAVANPNDAGVTVDVTFNLESGEQVRRSYSVGATARRTIGFGDVAELNNTNFGIVVEASLPIAAERTMYLDVPRTRQAGTTSTGVPYPSQQWYFAEGSNWNVFQTYVLLMNPGDTAANVRIEYHTTAGTTVETTHVVKPHARLTVDTLKERPHLDGQHFWMLVTSDAPVAAERAMYWDRGAAAITEGHSSHGVVEPSRHWSTGDGRAGGPMQYATWLLVGNPNTTAAEITMRIVRDSGNPIVSTRRIAPLGRDTIDLKADVAGMTDGSFWVVVDADVPVLVERSQYWSPEPAGGGWFGGSNTFALPIEPPDYDGCAYNVAPRQFVARPQGDRVTINVGATSRCTFTADPSAGWLRILSGDSGSGVSQVVVRVAANSTAVERTGTVLIAGQQVSIVQAPAPLGGASDPHMQLETPLDGAHVGAAFRVSGWAIDAAASDDTPGVSTVHIWALPNPGSGTPPVFLGVADVGGERADVARAYGENTRDSGFSFDVRGLAPGVYQIHAFAFSTITQSFNQARMAVVTVAPNPRLVIDTPVQGKLHAPAEIGGWALDLTADAGTGVDAIHVWALPMSGGPPTFMGVAAYGIARPDVAAAFGKSDFGASGYSLVLPRLAPGRYRLAVCARLTGRSEFDVISVVDVEVEETSGSIRH